jgi:hypothetical protein
MKRSVRVAFLVLIAALAAGVIALRSQNSARETRLSQAPAAGVTP